MFAFLKFGTTVLGIVLILIGLGAVLLYPQLARFAENSVEKTLTDALCSEVTVQSLRLRLIRHSIELTGVSLANPPDYREGPAILADSVLIVFDPKTLFAPEPVVETVVVKNADIFYRHRMGDGTNIGRLARLAAEKANVNGAAPTLPDGRTVSVRKIRCEGAQAHFKTNLVPLPSMPLDVVTVSIDDPAEKRLLTTRRGASLFLKSVIVQTLTLKGLLDPLIDPLRSEAGEL